MWQDMWQRQKKAICRVCGRKLAPTECVQSTLELWYPKFMFSRVHVGSMKWATCCLVITCVTQSSGLMPPFHTKGSVGWRITASCRNLERLILIQPKSLRTVSLTHTTHKGQEKWRKFVFIICERLCQVQRWQFRTAQVSQLASLVEPTLACMSTMTDCSRCWKQMLK